MKVAGFDIGGANTDLAVVDFENNEVKNIEVDFAYLPMWSNNEALPKVLTELIENICPIDEIDAVGISMTAELVDAYDTKKEAFCQEERAGKNKKLFWKKFKKVVDKM